MTIRRQLLLAAFALVLLFTLGLVLIVDRFVVDALAGSVLDQTGRSLDRLAGANAETARVELTRYGEELVAAHARAVAGEVALALAGRRDLGDYGRLRADEALRRVAVQDVSAGGRVVGYTCLLDLSGGSVIHPQRELVEKLGYRVYRESYPSLWHLVERSFTEPRVAGYYRFLDRQTTGARDKY
ncbi:MAG: hypothetical protein WCH74_08280, partial [Chloroflexota bacterium]